MSGHRKGSGWGPRTFTAAQWIKRDLRSAATRAEKDRKAGKRPITLAKTAASCKEPRP